MATLKEPVKIFIVQSLACMDTPQQVADIVKEEFKIEVTRQQVAAYDPTKYVGRNLSKKLVDLFHKTRLEFQQNILDIPVANKAYRLRELQRMYESWGKNRIMRQGILKQAFQETDGRVTRQEITGANGGPLKTETATKPKYTPDDLAKMSAQDLSRLCLTGEI